MGLVLGLLLDIYRQVGRVEVAQQAVEELKKLQRWLVVKFYQAQVAHEGRAVQTIDYLLDFSGV